MNEQYADVAPFIPLLAHQAQQYTYHIPAAHQGVIKPASVVLIPWRGREVHGVVLRVHQQPTFTHQTKALRPTSYDPLSNEQIKLAKWLAVTMHGGLGYTLRLFLPPSQSVASLEKPARKKLALPREKVAAGRDIYQAALPQPVAIVETDQKKRSKALSELCQLVLAARQQVCIITAEKWRAENLHQTLPAPVRRQATVVHADQPPAVLQTVWQQIKSGIPHVVIGTQKALYLPYRTLGLVVMDEEQLPAHKLWDQYPRLSGRYGIAELARLHASPLIYITEFPSLFLRHEIINTRVKLIGSLPNQPVPGELYPFSFSDRQQRNIVPQDLLRAIRRWHAEGRSILILANQDTKPLKHLLKKTLPRSAEIARIDAKTSQAWGTAAPIVIATTAVFTAIPQVRFDRLVWIAPERGLSYPDYRSEERAYYLLHRLLNLRAQKRTPFLLATKRPRFVEETLLQSPADFSHQQLRDRKKLYYPPVVDLVRLTVRKKTKGAAYRGAVAAYEQLQERVGKTPAAHVQIHGPFQELKSRARAFEEWHILLAGALPELTPLYQDLAIDRADLDPNHIL